MAGAYIAKDGLGRSQVYGHGLCPDNKYPEKLKYFNRTVNALCFIKAVTDLVSQARPLFFLFTLDREKKGLVTLR